MCFYLKCTVMRLSARFRHNPLEELIAIPTDTLAMGWGGGG